jgi:hypothetical protein
VAIVEFQACVTTLRLSMTPGRRESGSVLYVLGGNMGLSGMEMGRVTVDGSGESDWVVLGGEDVMG